MPTTVEPTIRGNYAPPQGSDEYEIWASLEKVEESINRSPLVIRDQALNDYVHGILCRLDAEVCPGIRIYLVRNPQFNAMMYPNGMMVIWTGLMVRMEDEAQLAAVIGHELGHYARQHSLQSWRRYKSAANTGLVVSLISAAAGAAAVGDLINLGILANLFQYSRDNETEADVFGTQRLAAAGYDPGAAASVWEYVEKEEQNAIYKQHQPMIFRSHPVNQDRFVLLRELAGNLPNTGDRFPDRYWQSLTPYYLDLVDDQLAMNKPGRSRTLLEEHQGYAVDQSLVQFSWGEYYRKDRSPDSLDKAMASYRQALVSPDAPPAAWRELGVLEMKTKDYAGARTHLQHYLDLLPQAEDAEIVKYYLNSIGDKT